VPFNTKILGAGNLFGNVYEPELKKKTPDRKNLPVVYFYGKKKIIDIRQLHQKSFKKASIGILTRKDEISLIDRKAISFANWIKKKVLKTYPLIKRNPQNVAYSTIFDQAKSHINIVSPIINSFELMTSMLKTMERGVDINFLLNQGYKGTSSSDEKKALEWVINQRDKLIKKHGKDKIGTFNLRLKSSKKKKDKSVTHKIYNYTKFIVADNQVAIIGSGSLDSDIWFDNGELNIIVDDHEIASNWCEDIFKKSFLKAVVYEDKKKKIGEKCFFNKECASGYCRKVKEINLFNKVCDLKK
jgi:phosphatidylserine/phosphatidylglycerophosphate/cardiolipin synthase-like enzyme